ncbi:hypothetical protein BBP40_004328 [Aspergillus hancockii]|nr:hypothetical protein BBP40_004328 [Aspergillus hancockii]
MSPLLRLPIEILDYIFELLDDLDNALHLARCWRLIYRTFNPPNTRLRIFRGNADHHALKLGLFLLTRLNRRFALYDKSPVAQRLSYCKEFFQQHLVIQDLPAAAIWEVACRWHAVRLHFNFYCDIAIRTPYSLSRWEASEEGWAGEDPLPPPAGSTCDLFKQLGAREKQRSYQRFYKAPTAHWLMVEMLWVARVAAYHSPELRDDAHARIWDLCTNTSRSLQEKIDIVEVVDFVWGFLARKYFHLPSFSIWLQGQREEIVRIYRE